MQSCQTCCFFWKCEWKNPFWGSNFSTTRKFNKNPENGRIFENSKEISKKVGELFSRTKDKTKDSERSGVIYRIPCCDFALSIIGQCSRRLKDRMVSHSSDVRLSKTSCALAEHGTELSHYPNFNRVKILNQEKPWFNALSWKFPI